jgi:hypothetical protein
LDVDRNVFTEVDERTYVDAKDHPWFFKDGIIMTVTKAKQVGTQEAPIWDFEYITLGQWVWWSKNKELVDASRLRYRNGRSLDNRFQNLVLKREGGAASAALPSDQQDVLP